jgi:hypothetical protein
MAPAFLFLRNPFLDMASSVWAMPEEQWIGDSPTESDIHMLYQEAQQVSAIDEINFRQQMIDKWKEKEVELKVKELPGRTRVVFLGTDNQWQNVPWSLWARIFHAIGHPIGRILFYAHPSKRFFNSSESMPLGPENINGGYTNICSQERIVIYRYEEATRVLVHELLHTACFDKEKGVEDLEAHTEAWTEIMLCAILSKGRGGSFNRLWAQQCRWIYHQCVELTKTVRGPADYAWRYITGKRDILRSLGFLEDCKDSIKVQLSPRFTTPEWPI